MSDDTTLTPDQQALDDLWEEHLRYEFQTRDTDTTQATGAARACPACSG